MREDTLVYPLYEREADGAPGAFYVVKDQCFTCALPPEIAPANVTWSQQTIVAHFSGEACPHHCRVKKQPETEEELVALIQAAHHSCVEAIRYCGTDPNILAKFKALGYERLCDAAVRRQA